MFQGKMQEVEFHADKSLLDVIFDVFGDNIKLNMLDSNTVSFKAEVQVSPTFLGWCCSFGNKLKVVGQDETLNELKNYILSLIQTYQNN